MISPLFCMSTMSISFGRPKSIFLSLNVKNIAPKKPINFFRIFSTFFKKPIDKCKTP